MACIGNRMVREVVSLEASATCAEAARTMASVGIGSVGVTQGGKLIGLVTERDLVCRLASGLDAGNTRVSELLRKDQPIVSPCATDKECAQTMRAYRTRHVLVKDGEEVLGVVSMLDLADLVLEEREYRIDQLESYIGGGRCEKLSEPVCSVFDRRVSAA